MIDLLLAQSTAAGSPLSGPVRGEWIAVIAVAGGIALAVVSVIAGSVSGILRTRAREQSRREIAAYVAEGTISPADAERILDAGTRRWERPGRGGCS
jgi:hypothetical protein